MVYRVFVEKKESLANEAKSLLSDLRTLLGITSITGLRIINRYDVEGIDGELFSYCKGTVFSEPQLDIVTDSISTEGYTVFAVEYLPGQFDQRADSAAQCIQLISQGERPVVRSAKVYLLSGSLTDDELARIKKHVINPVEAREASMEKFDTLRVQYDIPTTVPILDGFNAMDSDALAGMIKEYGLAMDLDDLRFCQSYFRSEKREPTLTEIRVIDTYWSDHCRHTTFNTIIDSVKFEDETLQRAWNDYLDVRKSLGRTKPICLMDIGTIAAKKLKADGLLDRLDESEEINACTVKIDVDTPEGTEKWLLLFKNETHNHPTEIEPFGGAATCIGGAIRDPLSGRSYVYAAMRVTGASDPTVPISETLPGKLPQRKIVTSAAAGYSSYGNQIGLATGIVDELYHPGYAAKRMEVGAVIAAAPEENVRRECPVPGDVVILLGGRTGRDGCGGATGSSKSHTAESLETCGAEVQKGNAPEERKLQRLFRNPEASKLIRRCNDFGAGGVSVAVGELADGLDINLNAVPKKYEGLDGTELSISESQERMAVVVSAGDCARFLEIAASENLEATVVATVTDKARLTMHWNGVDIVDISREFLDTNGAEKHISISPAVPQSFRRKTPGNFITGCTELAGDLNTCSRRGLSERFDSTIGAGTVLMPFGGKNQLTPIQAMAHKISREHGETSTCSFMSWAFDPYISEKSPYHGAYLAVAESVSKLIAAGAEFKDVYLSFQEYFEKPSGPQSWGKPMSALLGAMRAQLDLGAAAIGGKDSMSGTFEDLTVPPTLISFAVTTGKTENVISPEFKAAGHRVIWLKPEYTPDGLPEKASLKALFGKVTALVRSGKAIAVYTPGHGGAADAVMKMCLGNGLGFEYADGIALEDIFSYAHGSFIVELTGDCGDGICLGYTCAEPYLTFGGERIDVNELFEKYEATLENVYPAYVPSENAAVPTFSYSGTSTCVPSVKTAKPRVLIPVFPGTNCEYDSARAVERAGGEAEIFVINNLSSAGVAASVDGFAKRLEQSQMVFIPGGFSGGDEPDGSAKFITAFFRNPAIKEQVSKLLDERGGLMCGVCNGFQALIKLGLVPYGRIIDTDESCPTLTFNRIGRHQSRIVRTRISSSLSPWLAGTKVGDIYSVPISHGEGRFYASDELIAELYKNGQIATQYVDLDGNPTSDILFNPNGSACAIEGITSPDGRVFGKMGHSERVGAGLYKNVPGIYDMGMFESAVAYFK